MGPLDLQFGRQRCSYNACVAPIQDDMPLGLDLLKKYCDAIRLQEDVLLVNDEPIKMKCSGSESTSRVVVRRTVIPQML